MLKNLLIYFKSRFPVVPLLLYTCVTLVGIGSLFPTNITKIFALAFIYLLFLFHLRVLDEFKDFNYDESNHSERPLQKGLITLYQLRILGMTNVVLIFTLNLLVAPVEVTYLLLYTLLYTGLMYKEFFLEEKLKKITVLYLISHEIVFIPLFLYFFSVLSGSFWKINSVSNICLLAYLILPVVLIEIGRKMKHRYRPKGQKTNDTYAFIWGERQTVRVFGVLIMCAGFLSIFISQFNSLATLLILISGIIVFLMSYTYYRIIVNYNMIITVIFALGLPLCLLI